MLGQLPPELKTLMGMGKDIPSWLGPFLIDFLKTNMNKQKPPWVRPTIMNPRQNEIVDAICDETTKVILIEGDRRTGKSTSVWVAIHEDIWNGVRKHWGFWASTEETAVKIHNDIYKDNITAKETILLHTGHSQKRTQILDGSFTVNADTLSSASGKAYQGIWMDEFHLILKDNPATVATVAGILRSEPKIKLVISMNQGQGAYQLFKEKMEPLIEKGKAKFFTLLKSDTTHISDENDEIVDVLMQASMGEEFADAQLRNIPDTSGDMFNPTSLRNAYDTYETFMAHTDFNLPSEAFLAIDPSGTGHKWGYFLGGYINRMFYEIESGEIQMGLAKDGHENSPDRIYSKFLTMARGGNDRTYVVKSVAIENNTTGPHLRLYLQQHQINVVVQNFGSNESVNSRMAFIQLARKLLDEGMVCLKSQELYRQLLIYNPAKSTDEVYKGNLADAFLHFCWLGAGGLQQTRIKLKTRTESKVVWT